MGDFFNKATDPFQYDSLDLDWEKEGRKDSPTRKFFQHFIILELDVKGKNVIDIGCGMGQMVDILKDRGANDILGIDPASDNIAVARKNYPDVTFVQSTLEEYNSESKFSVALSIMVFEHMRNLNQAFEKVYSLLDNGGEFYLIFADKDYFLTPRFGYELDAEIIDNHTTAVRTKREYGLMYDMLRDVETYLLSAQQVGFKKVKHIPISPTDEIIKFLPKYSEFKGIDLFHLVIFKK